MSALVKERARAVAEEDFERALALHHQISALNISGQLADDNVKVSSPIRNGSHKEESLFSSIANLATLTLSPVTAITTMRMVTTPKYKSKDKEVVERLGDHGTVIAPPDSKLISKQPSSKSESVPKLSKNSGSSASWIAKEDKKPSEQTGKPRVTRSSSILERAANFSKKPEEQPTSRSNSATRSISKKPVPPLTVRVSSKEHNNSDSDTSGQKPPFQRTKSTSDEVMKKLKSVLSKEKIATSNFTSDSDNEELWMRKLSPEKQSLLKGCDSKPPPSPLQKKPDSPRAPKWSEKTSFKSNAVAEAKSAKNIGSQAKGGSTPTGQSKRVPSVNMDRGEMKRAASNRERGGSVKRVPSSSAQSDSEQAEPKQTSPKVLGKKKASVSHLFGQVDTQPVTQAVVGKVEDSPMLVVRQLSGISRLFAQASDIEPEPVKETLKRGKVFKHSPEKTVEEKQVPVEASVKIQSSNKYPAALTSKPSVGRDLPPVITGSAKAVYAEMSGSVKQRRNNKSNRNSMQHYGEWAGVATGDKCWVSDPHNAYLSATIETVISSTELEVLTEGDRPLSFRVDLEQKAVKVDKRSKPEPLRRLLPREGNVNLEDMDELPQLHEASILHNVDVRFRVDKIYTNTGPILIAMNPFKWLPIYDDDVMRQYLNRPRGALPPHCFAEAEASFQALNNTKNNQSIIICGDSGAGKTETTKLMLSYLSFVSETRYQGERPDGITMAEKLVESSPLLEALGNAKTLKNSNSSRFSKLSALQFSESAMGIGQIEGATLSNLLLESSRVSLQARGERNYHIFYQVN